jgi:hypothetical protein
MNMPGIKIMNESETASLANEARLARILSITAPRSNSHSNLLSVHSNLMTPPWEEFCAIDNNSDLDV